MANIKATYNSYDITLGKWSKTVDPILAENDAVTGERVTFRANGLIACSSASTLATAISTLHTALTKAGCDFKIWDGASATVDSLLAANCQGGGPVAKYSFPESPLRAGYNMFVEIEVSGTTAPVEPGAGGSGVLATSYKTDYSTDEQGRIVRTKSGSIRVGNSEDVNDHKSDVEPSLSADTYLTAESSFEGYERIGEKWTPDSDGLNAEFSFTDRAYFKSLPDSISRLDLAVSTADDGQQKSVMIRGTAYANSEHDTDAIKSQIDSIVSESKPEGAKVFMKTFDVDEYGNKVTFSVEIIGASEGGSQLGTDYSVSILYETPYDFASYAGGDGGVTQKTGSTLVTVTFRGTSRALNADPDLPSYSSDGALIRDYVDSAVVRKGIDTDAQLMETRFEKVWKYFKDSPSSSSSGGFASSGTIDTIQANLSSIVGNWGTGRG